MTSFITSLLALFVTSIPGATNSTTWVSLTDLLNSPLTYLGEEIAVSGTVHDVYNSHVFTVQEAGPFYKGRDVIVVVRNPQVIAVGGWDVTVTGIVQPFVRGELASEFNLTDIRSDILDQWETQPVMFARSVRTISGVELVAPLDRRALSTQAGLMGSSDRPIRSVAEISSSDRPRALVGRSVSLPCATVQHIAGTRSFWITDGSTRRTFVVVDGLSVANIAGREPRPGDVISVTGVVEAVPGTNRRAVVESWGRLDQSDATALEHEKVYVYANRIRVETRDE